LNPIFYRDHISSAVDRGIFLEASVFRLSLHSYYFITSFPTGISKEPVVIYPEPSLETHHHITVVEKYP